MTLNGIIALILRFFTEFDYFAGQLRHRVTVVEDRPIMSVVAFKTLDISQVVIVLLQIFFRF